MEDDDFGITPVLPVAEDSDTLYELELPPANGLDYLRRVRMEARSCPSTVTVELELPLQAKSPSCSDKVMSRSTMNYVPQSSPAPLGYAPSLEWQKFQVAEFSKRLAKEIQDMRRKGSHADVKLPAATNIDGWCQLCFGKTHNKMTKDPAGAEESDNAAVSPSDKDDKASDAATLPLLSIISQIDQDTLLLLLGYHIRWFELTGFSQLQGQWFYALLAALEKPLLPESCSLIRSLARNCTNLRASLDSTDNSMLQQLNLIICLVGDYFGQRDLCDTR
ncbi:gem-associated protein 2-like isoform X2 [Watersipora subatra]|uniref:gem-associated protein 2-like isoform X2 n=1 Tax=Watersipora subatra TaxID=2589382 RepID=UPI00355BE523